MIYVDVRWPYEGPGLSRFRGVFRTATRWPRRRSWAIGFAWWRSAGWHGGRRKALSQAWHRYMHDDLY